MWTFSTAAAPEAVRRCEAVLSPDESERASRFRFPHLRSSYVLTRGVLRHLLGQWLEVRPESLEFCYGGNGKPGLAGAPEIHFSVSHSGERSVLVLTGAGPVGIDLEKRRPLADLEQIVERFFAEEEAAELLALPPTERPRAFFATWTRKEACMKATGEGLSAGLDRIRVSVDPDGPARLLQVNSDSAAAAAWTLRDLAVDPDYAAAVAWRGPELPLRLERLDDLATLFAQGQRQAQGQT